MTTPTEREDKLLKKFSDKLPEDWRTRVEAMSTEVLKAEVILVSANENANQLLKEADEELAEAKDRYADLGAGYKEATTENKLKLKFLLRHLEANGAI